MDKAQLIKVHNLLMEVSVKGDSVEKLYMALIELTNIINSLPNEEPEDTIEL